MQVSPATCMGGAGQPHQLDPGDKSPPPLRDQGAFGEHRKNFLDAPLPASPRRRVNHTFSFPSLGKVGSWGGNLESLRIY